MAKPWAHDTHAKLLLAGYKHVATQACNGTNCKESVIWYETPNGRMMPMETMPDGRLQPHFSSCRDVGSFRRDK